MERVITSILKKKIQYDCIAVIPVFLSELFVEHCVHSIIDFAKKNVCVVLLIDKSCDNSFAICERLSNSFSNVYYIIKNLSEKGPAQSRNIGIEIARRTSIPYISFVDSDDWVSPFYIDKMIDIAMRKKCDLVYCNTTYYKWTNYTKYGRDFKDNRTRPWIPFGTSYKDIINFLLNDKIFPVVWGKLFSTSSLGKIRFKHLQASEDLLFLIEYFSVPRDIAFSENNYYYYLEDHPNSISITKNNKITLSHIESFFYIYNLVLEGRICVDIGKFKKRLAEQLLRTFIKISALNKSEKMALKKIKFSQKQYKILKNTKLKGFYEFLRIAYLYLKPVFLLVKVLYILKPKRVRYS